MAAAGRKLGIKHSTAKLIVKRYKENGQLFESKKEKKARLEKIVLNPSIIDVQPNPEEIKAENVMEIVTTWQRGC